MRESSRYKFLICGALLVSHLGVVARAQSPAPTQGPDKRPNNSATVQGYFDKPAEGGWSQIWLGVGEAIGAHALLKFAKNMNQLSSDQRLRLAKLDEDLKLANSLVTSTKAKQALVADLEAQVSKLREQAKGIFKAKNKAELKRVEELLAKVHVAPIVSVAEKTGRIKNASEAANDFSKAVFATRELSAFKKTLRVFARVGSVVLIADVLGRIYVWNTLKADPEWSPLGKIAWSKLEQAFSAKEVLADPALAEKIIEQYRIPAEIEPEAEPRPEPGVENEKEAVLESGAGGAKKDNEEFVQEGEESSEFSEEEGFAGFAHVKRYKKPVPKKPKPEFMGPPAAPEKGVEEVEKIEIPQVKPFKKAKDANEKVEFYGPPAPPKVAPVKEGPTSR